MLSIRKCTQELRAKGNAYTDEEVKQIRTILYQLANIEYENYKAQQSKKSYYLLKSIN